MAESVYWNKDIEALSSTKMIELQWNRIKDRLRYLKVNSQLYQKKFESIGLRLTDIQNLDDFHRLVPFTTKKELQEERERNRDPYGGLLCVPENEIVHLVRTGGTTGVPTIYGLTLKDLYYLGELTARIWYQIGARKGHTVACATLGCWNAFATALVEGLRTGGIRRYHFSMPISGEEIFPIEILPKWMDVQGIYLAPRPLWEVSKKYEHKLRKMLPKLEYLLMAGQHVTSAFRKGIEAFWGVKLFEAYPMTDLSMPSANCTEQLEAFHFPEDAFFLEVIDQQTGENLTGSGKVGEIVGTSLVLEGTPLLRFRTGDIGFTTREACCCGRTGMRLSISERMAHAVQIGDRLVFASEIEEILYAIPDFFLSQYYLVKKRRGPQEILILRVERPKNSSAGDKLKENLIAKIREVIGVESYVQFISNEGGRSIAGYKFLKVITE